MRDVPVLRPLAVPKKHQLLQVSGKLLVDMTLSAPYPRQVCHRVISTEVEKSLSISSCGTRLQFLGISATRCWENSDPAIADTSVDMTELRPSNQQMPEVHWQRSRMGVSRAGEGVLAFAHFPLQLSRTPCDPSTIEDCFAGTPKPTRETPAPPIYDKARAVALPPTGSSGGPQRELCRFSELKLVTLSCRVRSIQEDFCWVVSGQPHAAFRLNSRPD